MGVDLCFLMGKSIQGGNNNKQKKKKKKKIPRPQMAFGLIFGVPLLVVQAFEGFGPASHNHVLAAENYHNPKYNFF